MLESLIYLNYIPCGGKHVKVYRLFWYVGEALGWWGGTWWISAIVFSFYVTIDIVCEFCIHLQYREADFETHSCQAQVFINITFAVFTLSVRN